MPISLAAETTPYGLDVRLDHRSPRMFYKYHASISKSVAFFAYAETPTGRPARMI